MNMSEFNVMLGIIGTGAFAAMAMLGKIDQMLSPKGISMTIAPLGAVCAVLFCAPSSPAAKVLSFSFLFFFKKNTLNSL